MSKLKVYVIHDSKVGAFQQPFFARSPGEALRTWEVVANDGKSMISNHPGDFTLFETGIFDDETGRFTQHQALVSMGVAIEMKKQPPHQGELPLPLQRSN